MREVTFGQKVSYPGEFGNFTVMITEVVADGEDPVQAMARARGFVAAQVIYELTKHEKDRRDRDAEVTRKRREAEGDDLPF